MENHFTCYIIDDQGGKIGFCLRFYSKSNDSFRWIRINGCSRGSDIFHFNEQCICSLSSFVIGFFQLKAIDAIEKS